MMNNLEREDKVKSIVLYFFRQAEKGSHLQEDESVYRFIAYVNYELLDVFSIVI